MTDPIADMLSRITNGLNSRAETVDIPHSKIKEEILKAIIAEGYLDKFENLQKMGKKFLRVALKYKKDKKGVIASMKRVSRPGRRIYADVTELPRVQGGFGTAILTTSKGIMTDTEARAKRLGGEVVCYIW